MSTLTNLLHQVSFPATGLRSDLGILQISGQDAVRFLQGQTTCDFTTLTEQQALFGAFCSVQGRILSNFYAIRLDDSQIALLMSENLIQPTLDHLKKFSVFFKVEMSNNPQALSVRSLFSTTEDSQTQALYRIEKQEKTWRMNISTHELQHQLVIAAEKDQFDSDQSLPMLQLLESLTGQILIDEHASDRFIPQMLNMQLTEGISFKKGCYTGQEIVARMQYRGKLKKHMRLFFCEAKGIRSTDAGIQDKEGKKVGDLVRHDTYGPLNTLLAVVNDTALSDPLFLDGQALSTMPLPYKIPADDPN